MATDLSLINLTKMTNFLRLDTLLLLFYNMTEQNVCSISIFKFKFSRQQITKL